MKKIYYVLIAFAALLTFAPAVNAQKPADPSINGQIKDPKTGAALVFPKADELHTDEENQFAYSKNISQPFNDGTYWIKLESFSTGNATVKLEDAPADIVLVLDVSGSMNSNYGNTTGWYPVAGPNNNAWGWSSMANQEVYYKVGDNQYRPVYRLRERDSYFSPYRYYLYYEEYDNGPRHYLKGLEVFDSMPEAEYDQSGAIYVGGLWKQKRKARIDELKEAVVDFIKEIQDNDLYITDKETGTKTRRTDKQGNLTRLGNRVSIVKFAMDNFYNDDNLLSEGNHLGAGGSQTNAKNGFNYTELVKNLTYVDDDGVASLTAAVNQLVEGGATAADYGMQIANAVLAQPQPSPSERPGEATKTVVLFTDGSPTYSSGFQRAVASSTIGEGNTSKTTNEATVFTVGVFDSSNDNITTYMNKVSSNYKDATTMDNGSVISDDETKLIYYQDASDGNLKEVFSKIAKQSSGSQSALSTATSTVDVVSNSFKLPDNVDAGNIGQYVKVFTAKLRTINNGNYVWETEILAPWSDDKYKVYNEDGTSYTEKDVDVDIRVELKEGTDNTVKVLNFDYSNNWCGPIVDEITHTTTYQGHKIIIMIPIKMNPDAVGGPNVDTNGSGSGIFVNDTDESPTIDFISPTVSLPVNIHLTKTGLRMGESAKFKIERATIHEGDELDEEGVPVGATWNYVSTVFVTKNSAADPLVKVRGLPSTHQEGTGSSAVQVGYIYRITEEEWSWSYQRDVTPQYTVTSKVDNPFTFENTKTPGIEQKVRHAESKATNIFKPGETVHVKYDDSKARE